MMKKVSCLCHETDITQIQTDEEVDDTDKRQESSTEIHFTYQLDHPIREEENENSFHESQISKHRDDDESIHHPHIVVENYECPHEVGHETGQIEDIRTLGEFLQNMIKSIPIHEDTQCDNCEQRSEELREKNRCFHKAIKL